MRPLLTLVTLACLGWGSPANAGTTIRDFAQRDTRAVATCVYKQVGGQNLRLLVCKPDDWQAGQERPAMVWIHGGGWVAGEPELFLPHMKYSAARGAVALGVQYRLLRSPGHKHDKEKSQEENRRLRDAKLQAFMEGPSLFDCIADVQDAMRYIRNHAEELGVDPNRIALIGDSSGAHLACCAGTLAGDDARPNAVVACSAVTDLTSGLGLNSVKPTDGHDYDDPQNDLARMERARQLSPVCNVKKTDTVFLILHGARDWIKAERPKAFYHALKQAGNDCEFKLYEDARHAFIVYGYTATDEQITRAILDLDAFLVKRGLLEDSSRISMPETD